jgi:hypothetical protein
MLIKEEEDKKTPSNDHGFPSGCFLLRSASSARFLDVASDSVQDSSPIILWPAKDSSLVEGKSLIDPETFSHESDEPKAFRLPEARNQVSRGGDSPVSRWPTHESPKGVLHRHHRRTLRTRLGTRTRHRR